MIIEQARAVLRVEAEAITRLSESLGEPFEAVVKCLVATRGRVILSGIGKSGIICRKIAATFASTGTPAFFIHPAEAIHGDLGMVVEGDVVMVLSNSGETQELVRLMENLKRQGATLVAITGKETSTLSRQADMALTFKIEEEGCPMGLAPMASTTTSLALGDALAAAVMDQKGFTRKQFARYHPGGKLGRKLLLVGDAMDKHKGRPLVSPHLSLAEALIEISEKQLGMTAVDLGEGQLGLITDGDVRRLLQQHGQAALELRVLEVCTRTPKTISAQALAVEALNLMETHKITSIIVEDSATYIGVIHLHDLWRTQMI